MASFLKRWIGRSAGLHAPRLIGLVVLSATIVALAISATAPVRAVENRLSDLRWSLHGPVAPYSSAIVIVAVDDAALSGLPYVSPIDRRFLASVLAELDKRNPKAIGVDILLDRPSDPLADQALFDALEAARSPVVVVADPGAMRMTACGRGSEATKTDTPPLLPEVTNASSVGHGVQCVDGIDGVLRHSTLAPVNGMDAFPIAMATAAGDPVLLGGQNGSPIAFTRSEDGSWPFTTISAGQLAHIPDAWIAGRHVLVGQITPYSGDWRLTPLRFGGLQSPVEPSDAMPRGRVPGVVAHAYALDAVLTGRRGPQVGLPTSLAMALFGAVVGAGLGAARGLWWIKLAGVAAVALALWWAVFAAYPALGWMLPYAPAGLGLLLAAGSNLALGEREERARRLSIHNTFQHFLAPQVVNELVRSPHLVSRKAEVREVSALWTDLAGFTRLIDELPPQEAAAILNDYLDIVVQQVMDHGGAVDKIVGDAVHALFSAPIEDPAHRLSAATCAIDIDRETEAYRDVLAQRGITFGETRIGLNAGLATVGNFGASRRFDYTAHGSTINLAARLEAANKVFGTHICANETSVIEADGLVFREIGLARVRGISSAVRLFSLTGGRTHSNDGLERYRDAMACDVAEHAEAVFAELLMDKPDDPLVHFQLKRLRSGEWGQVIEL